MPEDREFEDYLSSELRQSAGREWQEEAAEDERLSEILRRRQQNFGDLARDVVHRGDRVRAELSGQSFSGQLIFAGSDYATLETSDAHVDIRLDAAVWTIEESSAGGHEQSGGSKTLIARLAETSAGNETVRVITDDGRAYIGSIPIVAIDHLEVVDEGRRVVVPIERLVAVVRPIRHQ